MKITVKQVVVKTLQQLEERIFQTRCIYGELPLERGLKIKLLKDEETDKESIEIEEIIS